jgi:shikimate kinase
MRIFLCGFMGSGKSVVGQALAKELDFLFVDLDKYIEEKSHQTISRIFELNGEVFFRELELEYLEELMVYPNIVIALGGGSLMNQAMVDYVKSCGELIYLKNENETLVDRLSVPQEKVKRPLIEHLSAVKLKKFVAETVKLRYPFYIQAHKSISNDNQMAAKKISKYIQSIFPV